MSKKQILVIDDEKVVWASVGLALRGQEYTFHFAGQGEMGLELMKLHQPDLVIVDLQMPVMDGIAFLAALRPQPQDPYAVIVLTGHGDDEDMRKCYDLGAHLFLRKPFSATELLCQVNHLLKAKKLESEVFRDRLRLEEELAERRRLEAEREKLIEELQSSLDEIKTLRGILPICSSCKKIRDDQGAWNRLELYIMKHSEAEFSHSLCPECVQTLYPGLCEDVPPSGKS